MQYHKNFIDKKVYGPYLLLIPLEKAALITLDTTVNCILKNDKKVIPLAKLSLGIAEIIEAEFNYKKFKIMQTKGYENQTLKVIINLTYKLIYYHLVMQVSQSGN